MTQPEQSEEHARLEERAEGIRQRFLTNPAFLDIIRRSQEDERAGRFVSHDELTRKHEIED